MYAILSIVSIASRNAHGIGQRPANSRHFMGTANNLCKGEYGFVLEYCGLFFLFAVRIDSRRCKQYCCHAANTPPLAVTQYR